jgi:photosystem II stability/assembly factor-like uncharacterized protein
VGESGTILRTKDSGETWESPTSGTSNTLKAIWGSTDVPFFTVGTNGTILYFDGSAWFPMNSGTNKSLNSVWGTSDSDVYVIGDGGTILHYDGSP